MKFIFFIVIVFLSMGIAISKYRPVIHILTCDLRKAYHEIYLGLVRISIVIAWLILFIRLDIMKNCNDIISPIKIVDGRRCREV